MLMKIGLNTTDLFRNNFAVAIACSNCSGVMALTHIVRGPSVCTGGDKETRVFKCRSCYRLTVLEVDV